MFVSQKVHAKWFRSMQKSAKILVLVGALTCLSSRLVWGATVWKDVTSTTDQFSVSMPGDAKNETESVKTDLGPIEVHEWIVDMGAAASFVTMVNQYPADHVAKLGTTVLLDQVQKGALGSDGKLRSQKALQVEGYPARELVVLKDKYVLYVRHILVNNRLYQLIASTDAANEATYTKDIQQYFNSFKLIK